MSFKDITADDRKHLQLIFADLKKLFEKDEILAADVDDFIRELESSEVKSYITSLKNGTKAEAALREAFFAGQSVLSRYLASEMSPEVNTGDGFIDYKIFSGTRFVMMELKPLFEAETQESHGGRELVRLKQKKLKWETYKTQILKYIKKGGEFIVITDLKDWYFFDDTVTKQNCKPFLQTDFHSLEKDFAMVENFYGLIERYNYSSIREDLDKVFFEDLKIWVKKLLEVEFNIEEKKKVEIVLGIINKFIFIQTLDDHSIIKFRWIQETWDYAEQRWGSRSKLEVLHQFFDDTIKWFFKFYDTELFVKNEVDFLKNEKENVDKFYDTVRLVLGLTYISSDIGGQRGIMQYKFRFIDEDIFGKAYETFLGEVRHEEGIYYTPKYITQHVVENTVGKIFDTGVSEIKKNLQAQNFDAAAKQISELTKIKILDPACGSGSFLIKAIREIWKRYSELSAQIEQMLREEDVYESLTRNPKLEEKVAKIKHLRNILGFKTNRELISKLLLRHIHGNDLDPRAIAVAKVNLWLEAVKLSPRDFRYDKLPADTNRILPYLEMNLVNGDAVVGLPDKQVVDYLIKNHKNELSSLTKLRESYLTNPTDPEIVDKIEEQKKIIRKELMKEFSTYLKNKEIPNTIPEITIPLFWPLEMWYLYFDNSKALPEEERGANCVIGNPPYKRIQVVKKKSPDYVDFLNNVEFNSATKNYDLAVIFIEKGYELLKKNGKFGYIVTNKFIQGDYGVGIRTLLSKQQAVTEIVDFGDQQVFKSEDATTYTALIFLRHAKTKTMKYCLVKKLQETIEQMNIIKNNNALETSELVIFEYENEKLTSEPWVFFSSSEDNIVKKIKKLPTLSKVSEQIFVGLQTSADPIYIVNGFLKDSDLEIKSKISGQKYVVEKELFKEILTGKDIKRWYVNWRNMWLFFPYKLNSNSVELIEEDEMKKKYPKTWQYLLDHKSELDKRENGAWANKKNWHAYVYEKNLDMFAKPKILTGVLADRSSFTIDSQGRFYFVGGGNAGGYGIALNKEYHLSLEYLAALLNSSFLDWLLRKKTSRFHGGFFSYAKRFIENLPVFVPDASNTITQKIEELVKQILENKSESLLFHSVWANWTEQMKDAERSIADIMKSEEDNIKEGDLKNTWFEKVSFFVSKSNELLKKRFDYFKIISNYEKNSIEIYGVNEIREESLFEFKFKEKSMLDHFYICLTDMAESRAKIETLDKLFERTMVPVLQPNPAQKTPNIMTKVLDEFSKVSKTKMSSIVKMENEISNAEARIDALVFKLYSLQKQEVVSIMSSLSLPQSYQSRVLEYFAENN